MNDRPIAEDMFALLIAPLRKGAKLGNQFYLFFKVLGRLFDGVRSDTFRLREESFLATASTEVLALHGEDRALHRFEGEDFEVYRRRLAMKGIVAAQAGTAEGIVSLVRSFGYESVRIEPLYLSDPTRWSEAILWISGGRVVLDDRAILQQEINRIKPGTNRITLAQEQLYSGTVLIAHDVEVYKIMDVRQV